MDVRMGWDLSVPLAGVVVLLFFYWIRNSYSFWSERGLKCPKPWPFLGNVPDMVMEDRQKLEVQWAKKYGKVYGVYIGMKPELIVADPETIIQLCVKDFNYNPNHDNHINRERQVYFGNFLFNLMDDSWKRVRGLMSPTFTSSKIRSMFKLLDTCAEDLVADTTEKITLSKGIIHLKNLFNLYTMNGISTCCYAMKLGRSSVTNPDSRAARDNFVKAGEESVKPNYLSLILYFILPVAVRQYFGVYPLSEKKLQPIADRLHKVIQHRRESSKKSDDMLQMLLDAKLTNQLELDDMDTKENHHASLTSESLQHNQSEMTSNIDRSREYLTDTELIANATSMLVAGLDTTSTLLSFSSYCLAHHPEIQEKLHRQLSELAEEGKMDYEGLTSCEYLDCVISESLRYLSPVTFIERQLVRDYRLEKYNLNLPKGLKISLALHAVMNDPDYWPEPEKYKPDRFLSENRDKIVPGSYCPFGIGPRHCIGMRFALAEAKLGLAKIITRFQLSPAPGTVFPPPAGAPMSLTILKAPYIEFRIRNGENMLP